MSAQRGGRRQENPGSGQDTEGQYCCFTKTSRRNVITAITRKNLNSNGKFLKIWNVILLASCVYAIAVDPLFFFVLVINEDKKCLQFHNTLYFVAVALRSVADLISLANIIFEFRTSYIDKKKAKLGKTELVGNAKRYLRTYFLVDVLTILPLPQGLFPIFIFREMRSSKYSGIRKILNALIPLQYVPRAIRIFGSWEKFSLTNKKIDQDLRFKCLFNLILYILAAQVMGALWYFLAVDQEMTCWQIACEKHIGSCIHSSFSCDSSSLRNYTFINDYCPIKETQNTISYDFGIFHEAIQLGILASTDIPRKIVHCFWWGLRNLSSSGQNLQSSGRFWETLFVVSISIFGLLLFLYIIGNLQMCMQAKKSVQLQQNHEIKNIKELETVYRKMKINIAEIKTKTRSWMIRHDLPPTIERNINVYLSKIEETGKEVDMENTLPIDWLDPGTNETIKAHLCLPLLKKVLHKQNGTLLKLILQRLRPVYYKEGSYIFREGEPIDRMVFFTSGTVLKLRTLNGQGTVLEYIENGDNLDEINKNILDWGFKLESSTHGLSNLPISESTLKTHTEVDGFHLRAKELMEVFRKAPSNIEEAVVDCTPWKVQIDHRQPAQGGGSTSTTLESCEGPCKCHYKQFNLLQRSKSLQMLV